MQLKVVRFAGERRAKEKGVCLAHNKNVYFGNS